MYLVINFALGSLLYLLVFVNCQSRPVMLWNVFKRTGKPKLVTGTLGRRSIGFIFMIPPIVVSVQNERFGNAFACAETRKCFGDNRLDILKLLDK